jgi:hypothetical protein
MTFAPQYRSKYVPQDYLTEGERIFVRQQDRRVPFDWSSVEFDPKIGRLVHAKTSKEYRDTTYLVVDVLKLRNPTGTLSQSTFQELSKLIDDIKGGETLKRDDLVHVQNSVTDLINTARAETDAESSLHDMFDSALPKGQRAAIARNFLEIAQSSMNESDKAKKEFPDAVVERGLRIVWKRFGEAQPSSTAIADLTVQGLKSADKSQLDGWADSIAAIYDKS